MTGEAEAPAGGEEQFFPGDVVEFGPGRGPKYVVRAVEGDDLWVRPLANGYGSEGKSWNARKVG